MVVGLREVVGDGILRVVGGDRVDTMLVGNGGKIISQELNTYTKVCKNNTHSEGWKRNTF